MFRFLLSVLDFFFPLSQPSQNNLWHVYSEASVWLFTKALWQIPRVYWRIPYIYCREISRLYVLRTLVLLSYIIYLVWYFVFQVLPILRKKHDEFLLRELVIRWENHQLMIRWLQRFFNYLDRYFVTRNSLPSLKDVGLTCFFDLVSYWSL